MRTFFLTAAIPGLPEKIPVYGIKETRMVDSKSNNTYVKLQTFVFNGQDRVPIGVSFYTVTSTGALKEFHLFSHKTNNNLLTGNIVNNNPQIYNNQGQSIIIFVKQNVKRSKKTKNKLVYEAREMNSTQRQIALLYLSYEKSGWDNRKMKELKIEFTDVSDYITKPQVVTAAFMLIYSNKLL